MGQQADNLFLQWLNRQPNKKASVEECESHGADLERLETNGLIVRTPDSAFIITPAGSHHQEGD
jgi:hypothetical protein